VKFFLRKFFSADRRLNLSFLELQKPFKCEKLIGLVTLTAVIFAVFFNTQTTEHVEFGQTLAGLLPININNEFYIFRQQDSSLQIVLPALLLKMGMASGLLGVIISVACQVTAFLAVTLVTYFLTQSSLASFFSIFLYFKTLPNGSHLYPLYFPIAFSAFGALGTWMAILCVGLWLNDFKKTAMFFLGLLLSVHLVWFLVALTFLGFFIFKERASKRQVISFLVGIAISCSSFLTFRYFKTHYFEKSFYKTEYDTASIDQTQWTRPHVDGQLRTTFQLHNPRIIQPTLSETLKQFWSLNQASVYFFLLIGLLFLMRLISKGIFQSFAIPYALIYVVTLLSLAFVEWNDVYSMADPVATLVLRAIPNRFLNVAFALTPALCVSSFFRLYIQGQDRWIKGLAVLVAILYLRDPNRTLPLFIAGLFLLQVVRTRYPNQIRLAHV